MIDFTLNRENNIFLLQPLSKAAKDWCSENLGADCMKWGGAFVIDQHCIEAIVSGTHNDGLTIK